MAIITHMTVYPAFTGTAHSAVGALDTRFRPHVIGHMFESGLAHLAGTHMIAAADNTDNISLGCKFYQARYYLTEDVLEAPFACENGKVQVPTASGLGGSAVAGKI